VEGPKQWNARREDPFRRSYAEKKGDIEMDLKEMRWDDM
jgi:hypothetical protein